MIAKIGRGSRFQGLMAYLVGPGRENEHEDPHLVGGDPAIAAWHVGQELDSSDAASIARQLEAAHELFGADVSVARYDWDPAAGPGGRMVARRDRGGAPVRADQHVWHASLSLPAEDGVLTDEQWGQITHEFMARMGFDDPQDPREPAQWVAVRHGLSGNGNDHVHVAASVVRTDGTKVSLYNDYKRAGQACRALETKFGLRVVEGREPGFERNEQAATLGDRREHERRNRTAQDRGTPGRDELDRDRAQRTVRACASAASDEAEFVRRLRRQGLAVRPRFAKGTDEVVTGYAVAIRGADGQVASRYMGGQKLARDLSLQVLRTRWPDTPEAAASASAEWRAGARNLRPAAAGRETRDPDAHEWRTWHEQMGRLTASLGEAGRSGDAALWARAAREASGAFAAWSVRTESTPGPLAQASKALSRSAFVTEQTAQDGQRKDPGKAGDRTGPKVAPLLMVAGTSGRRKHLDSLLLAQMMRLAQAVHQVHQEQGRAREAQHIEAAVRQGLAQVRAGMPPPLSVEKFDDPQTLLRAEQAWRPPGTERIAARPPTTGQDRARDRDERARGGVER